MGIIDLQAQSKALLARLIMKGLLARKEPWKTLVRWKMTHTQHFRRDALQLNICWFFADRKFKKFSLRL
jgi:hypothetical protein